VDDQGNYLDALRASLNYPGRAPVTCGAFIDSPDTALETIGQESKYWRSLERLLAEARDAREERGEAKLYIERYFTNWRRFHLTSVFFVDYAMPGMNGIELLERLQDCPSRRVLLTGEADEQVAIRAFNAGQIQMFIPKNTPNLLQTVRLAIDNLHRDLCEHLGHLIRSTLSEWQLELLHDRHLREGLARKLEELEWIEYVVVGRPFGMLGMKEGGPLQWLQLETRETLEGLAEGLAEMGVGAREVARVRAGNDISCDELLAQLGIDASWKGHLIPTDDVCNAPHVVGALCHLPVAVVSAKDYGLAHVSTPSELMRSLIRDVRIANDSKQSDPDGYRDAVNAFRGAAAISAFHREAARKSLDELAIHEQLRADLDSAAA
jgi:CheY-like chemotaxis protein